ncbi:flagellar protein FliT [Pusillimonas sp. TS35]|uniref:flagellar protein FliT n=1 Tax=Paracandidimonas lactea TaxID=2895524 RepID=UPI00136AFD07|nr:flagellar protein FliT [Paracandidimonas lactea]MYN11663.1 flagellar protein FliT [Pusillimonas sp. TS35]
MTERPVLPRYETIARIVRQMLLEAKAQHWREVASLGVDYHAAVEKLRDCPEPCDEQERMLRKRLLARILEDDASVRSLISPEMDRLAMLLGGLKQQRAVLHAYYQQSGS